MKIIIYCFSALYGQIQAYWKYDVSFNAAALLIAILRAYAELMPKRELITDYRRRSPPSHEASSAFRLNSVDLLPGFTRFTPSYITVQTRRDGLHFISSLITAFGYCFPRLELLAARSKTSGFTIFSGQASSQHRVNARRAFDIVKVSAVIYHGPRCRRLHQRDFAGDFDTGRDRPRRHLYCIAADGFIYVTEVVARISRCRLSCLTSHASFTFTNFRGLNIYVGSELKDDARFGLPLA